jgi:hypothetical protein
MAAMTPPLPELSRRSTVALLSLGVALAIAAPLVAPSSDVLSAPRDGAWLALAVVALTAAYAVGFSAPRTSIYLLIACAVAEGAFRKWVVNDVTAFLVKDFLALGLYARVLFVLRAREARRSAWVLVPLAGLLLLAVAYVPFAASASQGLIGLRAYAMYVPLLWVAPKLLDTPRRLLALVVLVLGLGVANALLATVQALTGGQWLNRTAPGALPAVIVVDGLGQIRPTGTMLQVGTLSAFLLFPFLAAFALVLRYRRGWGLGLGLAGITVLSWGVVYTGSRALLATTAAAAVVLLAYLVWVGRYRSALAVPAMLVAGALVLVYQPLLGGPVRGGSDSHFLRNQAFSYIDVDGKVKTRHLSIGRGDPKSTLGYVQRAADRDVAGNTGFGQSRSRVAEQVHRLGQQGLTGHGTGSMALGTQYLLEERPQAAESEYVRVAHELGFPGLVFWLWFLAAVWVSAAWSSFVAYEWRRPVAFAALGAAALVPALTTLTYAFQFPIVSILYYTLAGCALAWASRAESPPEAAA